MSSRTADESTPRLSRAQAVEVVRELLDGDSITPRFVLALEVLIECASAPPPLAVRQDIEALKREAARAEEAALGKAPRHGNIGAWWEGRARGMQRVLDVLGSHLARLSAPPSAEQVADALDEAARAWYESKERSTTHPPLARRSAMVLFQARAVLALLGAS